MPQSTGRLACVHILQDFAKLPWELDMPHEKAAAVLGSYLGVNSLEPASVLDLDVDQITGRPGAPLQASAMYGSAVEMSSKGGWTAHTQHDTAAVSSPLSTLYVELHCKQ